MRTERIVFAVAAAAVVARLVDHLIVGVVLDLQFNGVLAFSAVTIVATLAYPRLPWQLQAVGSIALGLGRLVGDFVLYALPTIRDGPQATDYTGLGATVAGGLLPSGSDRLPMPSTSTHARNGGRPAAIE